MPLAVKSKTGHTKHGESHFFNLYLSFLQAKKTG